MTYDNIVQLISTVGFPICVAGYCLYILNTTMKSLTESINHLTDIIDIKLGGGN